MFFAGEEKQAEPDGSDEEQKVAGEAKEVDGEENEVDGALGEEEVDGEEKEAEYDADDLFCLCQKPFDKERLMLDCDNCEEWYHLPCMQQHWGLVMYKFEAENITHWRCEKAGCDGRARTAAEVKTYTIVDEKVDDEGERMFSVRWPDHSRQWAAEDEVPDESLQKWRERQDAKSERSRSKSSSRSPAKSSGRAARRAALPKRGRTRSRSPAVAAELADEGIEIEKEKEVRSSRGRIVTARIITSV